MFPGSPPRMRGKRREVVCLRQRRRITPAHAGKTSSVIEAWSQRADHPRACGENRTKSRRGRCSRGSPPRMRGKRAQYKRVKPRLRITPAHAGKTGFRGTEGGGSEDHPRACGENCHQVFEVGLPLGSPPRMRGKLPTTRTEVGYVRITPAHAGKTHKVHWCTKQRQDHPRACGENRQMM